MYRQGKIAMKTLTEKEIKEYYYRILGIEIAKFM